MTLSVILNPLFIFKSALYYKKDGIVGTGVMMLKAILTKGFLILFLFIIPCHIQAIIEIQGTIFNDTTWTNQDTIKVCSTVTVPDSVQLTIEPGTFIFVNFFNTIEVHGMLIAQGDENDKIVFTSSADTLGGSPKAGSWRGIFYKQNSSGILQHCEIKYAYYAITAEYASIEVQDCTIEDFQSRGFDINGGTLDIPPTIVIDACTVRQNEASLTGKGTGIYVYQSTDIAISRCRVNNCEYGIDLYSHKTDIPHFQINSCDIRDNTKYGIYIHVCG